MNCNSSLPRTMTQYSDICHIYEMILSLWHIPRSISLHSHQQSIRVPIGSHTCQHCPLYSFLIFANLMLSKHPTVFLFLYLSLGINSHADFLVCELPIYILCLFTLVDLEEFLGYTTLIDLYQFLNTVKHLLIYHRSVDFGLWQCHLILSTEKLLFNQVFQSIIGPW